MKSAREIVEWTCYRYAEDKTVVDKALKQLEAEINRIIGEDEAPDTQKAAGIKDGLRLYEPSYSLRATVINESKAKQRQRLREFLGGQE